jgi:predicted DNA-binding transcriptional regulator YafY
MPSGKITRTQRWLDLISYLIGRHYPVGIGELLERLPAYRDMEEDSARRVFERDKQELISAGIPIDYQQLTSESGGSFSGYLLRSGDFFLPYLELLEGVVEPRARAGKLRASTLELAPEHLADAMEGLRRVAELPDSPLAADARRGFAKIAFDLDADAVLEGAPVHVVEPPGSGEHRATLGALSDALIERRPVWIRYRGITRDETSERWVDPYGLMITGGRWYLLGHDHLRDGIREFRVERIETVRVRADEGAARAPFFSVPGDFSLDAYAHRQAWELGEGPPVEARVRFRFPWSLWADRNGYGEWMGEDRDGSAVRSFGVLAPDAFLRWLLSAEAEPELVGPPELVDALHRLTAAIAGLYAHDEEPDADT